MARNKKKQELYLAYVTRDGKTPSLSHYALPSARGFLTLRRQSLTSVQEPVWPALPIEENCTPATV